MIGRRGFVVAASLAAAAGWAPGLAANNAVPPLHPAFGGGFARLARRISDGGGPAIVSRPGRQGRYGALLAGGLPFPAAALFAGMPFGMGAADLCTWAESREGRQVWDEGWAGAGLHALPCGMLETRLALFSAEPIERAENMSRITVTARPGLVAAAWRRLQEDWGAGGVGRAFDAATGWAEPSSRYAYAAPFAYGQMIEFAMPLDVWRALPGAARRAVEDACRAGLQDVAQLDRPSRPLPAPLAAGLAHALASTLREDTAMPEPRRLYAAARLDMAAHVS